MLDMVFVVDDPIEWHSENLNANWNHYSVLRYFGSRSISRIQSYAAGVYYNTFIKVDSQVCKSFLFMI